VRNSMIWTNAITPISVVQRPAGSRRCPLPVSPDRQVARRLSRARAPS